MNNKKMKNFIQNKFQNEETGQDWWHIERVWKLAKLIGKRDGANLNVFELGAPLHEITDWKFHKGDLEAGLGEAICYLRTLNVNKSTF